MGAEAVQQTPGKKRPRTEAVQGEPYSKSIVVDSTSEEVTARHVKYYAEAVVVAKKLTVYSIIKGLDVLARKGPKLRLGQPVVRRAMNEDLPDNLIDARLSREHLANKKGLILSELATIMTYEAIKSKAIDDLKQKLNRQIEKNKVDVAKAVGLLKYLRAEADEQKVARGKAEEAEKIAK